MSLKRYLLGLTSVMFERLTPLITPTTMKTPILYEETQLAFFLIAWLLAKWGQHFLLGEIHISTCLVIKSQSV